MVDVARDVACSVVGSTACVYTGQPLDTVKLRLQATGPGAAGSSSSSTAGLHYKGPMDCARQMIRAEGVLSLWKGSVPALLGQVTENIVSFSLNGVFKRLEARLMERQRLNMGDDAAEESAAARLEREERERVVQRYYMPWIRGSITGFFAGIALCPPEVIKCRLQALTADTPGAASRSTFWGMLKYTVQHDGPTAIFRGLAPALMRDVPFYCAFFGSYEVLGEEFKDMGLSENWASFMAGGFAGQLAWLAGFPMDRVSSVIKTADKPLGLVKTTQNIVAAEGVSGLFRGLSATIVRAFPANAVLFLTFSLMQKLLGGGT